MEDLTCMSHYYQVKMKIVPKSWDQSPFQVEVGRFRREDHLRHTKS